MGVFSISMRYKTMSSALSDARTKSTGRPLMILMVAPPGAGKSTVIEECKNELESMGIEVVSTDAYVVREWQNDPAGNDLNYEKGYKKYYDRGSASAELRVDELCESASGVLFDRCNLDGGNRQRLLEKARASGMYSVCCVLPVPAAECAKRNASRGERAVREGAIWGLCKKHFWKGAAHADRDNADLVCVIESAGVNR